MPDVRTRWTLRSAAAGVAVLVGSAVVVAEASALVRASAAPEPPPGAAFELSDDDSGAALFTATGLRPGAPVSNCISVAHNTVSGDSPLQLRLHGASSGLLADRLRVDVEAGNGAAFGDCSTFAGQLVYTGTLGAFVANHADAMTGIAVPARGASGTVAFRFTATVLDDNVAQGTSVDATFTWDAEVAPPPTTVPPTTAVPTTAAPTNDATPTGDAATASDPATGATTTPATPATPAAPDKAGPGAGGSRSLDVARRLTQPSAAVAPPATVPDAPAAGAPAMDATLQGDTAGTTGARSSLRPLGGSGHSSSDKGGMSPSMEVAWRALAVVATKGSFPLVLVLVLVLFLWVQDRIDRRDPKLALAPVHADPDLHFTPVAGGRA